MIETLATVGVIDGVLALLGLLATGSALGQSKSEEAAMAAFATFMLTLNGGLLIAAAWMMG